MPSASSLGCFWPLLCVCYRLSMYVKLLSTHAFFHALDFLSLTIFSHPYWKGTGNLSVATTHVILYVVQGEAVIVVA